MTHEEHETLLNERVELLAALRTASRLGAGAVPPTYMSGVLHATAWAERELTKLKDSRPASSSQE